MRLVRGILRLRELFRVFFQHGGLVCLDRAAFQAQRDHNLAGFFLRAALAALAPGGFRREFRECFARRFYCGQNVVAQRRILVAV